jgi:hypothetical protein
VLLAAVSNVLINHVALLVIDEIERVANDSKRGETLINYLTQLVNQSNVAICFVGNESANRYFATKEYMSRRTIGVSIQRMEYDEAFYKFLNTLFKYQYTKEKIELTPELARTIYKLTNGAPAMIVSLFVETQRSVILNGTEKLDSRAFEVVFRTNFTNMLPYLDLGQEKTIPTKKPTSQISPPKKEPKTSDNLFVGTAKVAGKNAATMLTMLAEYVNVEFISL